MSRGQDGKGPAQNQPGDTQRGFPIFRRGGFALELSETLCLVQFLTAIKTHLKGFPLKVTGLSSVAGFEPSCARRRRWHPLSEFLGPFPWPRTQPGSSLPVVGTMVSSGGPWWWPTSKATPAATSQALLTAAGGLVGGVGPLAASRTLSPPVVILLSSFPVPRSSWGGVSSRVDRQWRSSEAEKRKDHLGDLSFGKMELVSSRCCGVGKPSG